LYECSGYVGVGKFLNLSGQSVVSFLNGPLCDFLLSVSAMMNNYDWMGS